MSGATGNIGRRHAERLKDRLAYPLGDADAGRGLNHLAEDIEALVRVDPALLGSSDGAAPLERQARGVGEQVTDRRPLGTAGSSRDIRPRSTATSTDQATIGLVTDASGNTRSTSPYV